MRHHILIPTDFSDNAWSAALYAMNLYGNEPCTFYFLYAWTFINSGSRTYISPTYIDTLKDNSKSHLATLKKRAIDENINSDHEFQTIFCVDSLTDSIKVAIKKNNIDLVVMGTKGATGAIEYLFGSNTVTVIRKVRLCPLLLVPNDFEFVTPDHIAFPTDFNRTYGNELQPLKKVAGLHNSKIEVLHINLEATLTEKQTGNLEMLKADLEDQEHHFNWMSHKGKKAKAISSFIEQNNTKMLAMINYEHGFIEDLIKEPIIKRIGNKSVIPFLVIPYIPKQEPTM